MYYNDKGEPCGLVYNIQRYTIHDGPGIRTEIFFKGCPMHCPWCSNPESICVTPQIGVYPSKCLGQDKCNYCVRACPHGGSPIHFDSEGILTGVDMLPGCQDCLRCVDECPSRAVMVWGEKKSVAELMEVIEGDRSFYERTHGGVTLNGGEVMLQWEFVSLLLKACKEAEIQTCVESALNCATEHVECVLKYTDILYADIKHMDSAVHKRLTGAGNELILKNLKHVAELETPLVIRTPVVPGYNDDDENIRRTAAFIRDELGGRVVQYQLLPYRKMGTEKYATLNQPYPMGDYEAPERAVWEENLLRLKDMVYQEYGIPVVAGSSQKLPGY